MIYSIKHSNLDTVVFIKCKSNSTDNHKICIPFIRCLLLNENKLDKRLEKNIKASPFALTFKRSV